MLKLVFHPNRLLCASEIASLENFRKMVIKRFRRMMSQGKAQDS